MEYLKNIIFFNIMVRMSGIFGSFYKFNLIIIIINYANEYN